MKLNELSDNPGARRPRKRVGRGIGSGKGKTCGSGTKGQRARSGVAIKGFEGGQMPLHRRLPKRGFKSLNRQLVEVVNLGRLQHVIDVKKIDLSQMITREVLKKSGLVKRDGSELRLLGTGLLSSKISIEVDHASATAMKAVEKMGGEVILPKTAE